MEEKAHQMTSVIVQPVEVSLRGNGPLERTKRKVRKEIKNKLTLLVNRINKKIKDEENKVYLSTSVDYIRSKLQ